MHDQWAPHMIDVIPPIGEQAGPGWCSLLWSVRKFVPRSEESDDREPAGEPARLPLRT